jgi:D-mannonate dehydratase
MVSGIIKHATSKSKGITTLSPLIKNIKDLAEAKLATSTDYVMFNKDASNGITDLSFEKHIDQKRVSLYFDTSDEGIDAYRQTVKRLADLNVNNLELKYTPQFGQTRISFEWNHFFEFFNSSTQISFLNSFATSSVTQFPPHLNTDPVSTPASASASAINTTRYTPTDASKDVKL